MAGLPVQLTRKKLVIVLLGGLLAGAAGAVGALASGWGGPSGTGRRSALLIGLFAILLIVAPVLVSRLRVGDKRW